MTVNDNLVQSLPSLPFCISRLLEMPRRSGMTTPADLESTWTYSLTLRYSEVPVTGSRGPFNLPTTETQAKAPEGRKGIWWLK